MNTISNHTHTDMDIHVNIHVLNSSLLVVEFTFIYTVNKTSVRLSLIDLRSGPLVVDRAIWTV